MSGRIAKIEREGKVAVLHAGKAGYNWYTFNGMSEMLFDPRLIVMVEAHIETGDDSIIPRMYKYCMETYGEDEELNFSALPYLEIEWVPKGKYFYIDDRNGQERVVTTYKASWLQA